MGKLLKLLNEYVSTFSSQRWTEEQVFQYPDYVILISKRFGFINWLVENDKIDMKKHFYNKMNCVGYPDLNIVLCELAVSDTPIDDLISYLR